MSVCTDKYSENTSNDSEAGEKSKKSDTCPQGVPLESISISSSRVLLDMGHISNLYTFLALLRLERERHDVSNGTPSRHGEENERPITAHMVHLVVEGFLDRRRRGPNAYPLLDNLVELDLVAKQRCPNSRSSSCYQVSDEGWEFAEEIGAISFEFALEEAGAGERRQKMGLQEFYE